MKSKANPVIRELRETKRELAKKTKQLGNIKARRQRRRDIRQRNRLANQFVKVLIYVVEKATGKQ